MRKYFMYTTLLDKFSTILCFLKSAYQLHVPVQLPCYDFVPVKNLPTQAYVSCRHSGQTPSAHLRQTLFQTVTGGLYRTPEPVHRNLADLRLLAIPSSRVSNCRKRFVLGKHFSKKPYGFLKLISSL